MTEIPEHLLKRARESRERHEAGSNNIPPRPPPTPANYRKDVYNRSRVLDLERENRELREEIERLNKEDRLPIRFTSDRETRLRMTPGQIQTLTKGSTPQVTHTERPQYSWLRSILEIMGITRRENNG
jgi:hypothetical protein